ncbi:MAG TPA: FxsA family protein [Phycicoccus sp.]|nr:FxsA family protein [Phycicoccus sp.]HRA46090.1 FxsA family protein [Phycicoccus sp.]
MLRWLLLALIVGVALEIAALVSVAKLIGIGWTIGLLVVESLIGAWLVKREGRAAWRAFRTAVSTGEMPPGQLADAAIVLIGGLLLLAPGFLTDLVGFFLVLPFTRGISRRWLETMVSRRFLGGMPLPTTVRVPGTPGRGPGPDDPNVVQGEVVDG